MGKFFNHYHSDPESALPIHTPIVDLSPGTTRSATAAMT